MSELEGATTEAPANELQGTVDELKATVEKQGRDHASMMGRYKAVEDQLIAARAENETLKASTVKTADDTDENIKLKAEVGRMQELVQKQEAREERIKTTGKRQAIVSSLKAAGGDDSLSELAADSILLTAGKSIQAVENDNGSFDVFHMDAAGMPTPIADFIGNQYMTTDAGKHILAAKAGPSIPGGSGPEVTNQKEISSLEFSRLAPEERKNYRVV